MESVQLKYYMHKRLYEYIWAQGGWFKNNIGYMVQKGIDRPSLGGCQGPTTYSLMIRWWEINLIRVFLVIKADIFSMKECWYHLRGKGFGGKSCVGRRRMGPTHIVCESPHI